MVKRQDTIIKLLSALFPDAKIYLFGSRARGNERDNSDIDIALDAGHKLSFFDMAEAKNVIQGLYIGQEIDIVDLNSVPTLMREIILNEGVVWKA